MNFSIVRDADKFENGVASPISWSISLLASELRLVSVSVSSSAWLTDWVNKAPDKARPDATMGDGRGTVISSLQNKLDSLRANIEICPREAYLLTNICAHCSFIIVAGGWELVTKL